MEKTAGGEGIEDQQFTKPPSQRNIPMPLPRILRPLAAQHGQRAAQAFAGIAGEDDIANVAAAVGDERVGDWGFMEHGRLFKLAAVYFRPPDDGRQGSDTNGFTAVRHCHSDVAGIAVLHNGFPHIYVTATLPYSREPMQRQNRANFPARQPP